MKDAQDLRLRKITEGNAQPLEDDLYKWHGNILIPLQIDEFGDETKNYVMHFLIELPKNYP